MMIFCKCFLSVKIRRWEEWNTEKKELEKERMNKRTRVSGRQTDGQKKIYRQNDTKT